MQLNKGPYFAVNVRIADQAGLRITQAVYPPRTRLPRHGLTQPYLCLVAAGGFEERLRRRSATCTAGTVIWNPSSACRWYCFWSRPWPPISPRAER